MSIIKNGLFTGKKDVKDSAICCGDNFVTLYDNTQWTVEYNDEKCGFVARSGAVIESLSRFKSNQIRKIRK